MIRTIQKKKRIQRILIVFVVTVLVLPFLTACNPIEDINGENDKTLATITDERLTTSISGSISIGNSIKKGSPTTQRFSNDGGISDESYDYDQITFDFTRFNGTQKCMITYLMAGEVLEINFNSQISKGNFAAVLLSTSNVILGRFEADEYKSITIIADKEGDYLLIIAGESAEGSIEVKREIF